MSAALLGESFDIHGGGIDLVFPHHENEIAQSRCCFGTERMARYWLHNGYLQVEGEKMSKSLGNFVTVRDLLSTEKFGGRKWPGEVLRLAMLSTQYTRPLDFAVRGLEDARNRWRRWGRTCRNHPTVEPIVTDEFIAKLLDDLNTPAALRLLSKYGTEASGPFFGSGLPPVVSTTDNSDSAAKLKGCAALLGLHFDETTVSRVIEEDVVNSLIGARLTARAAKNWAEADRIRDELAAMGIVLMDRPDGTTEWEVAR
jgi:cysteinyl-tRNA synthetase